MMRTLICALIVAVLVVPCAAQDAAKKRVTRDDFLVKTTQQLLNLCTACQDDPHYKEAIHFCYGYLIGAYHYYVAANAGPDGKKLVCPPDPPPTRTEAIKMFIEWAKKHPEYAQDPPVETEFRFLMEEWPCDRK